MFNAAMSAGRIILPEKNVKMLIKQLVFVVRDVRTLTMPRHQIFRELRSINRLRLVSVGRSILAPFSDEVARWK